MLLPMPSATSEKFVLEIVLLDAFLDAQGHDQPIEALCMAIRSTAHSPRNTAGCPV
jgi:hypothetical protein